MKVYKSIVKLPQIAGNPHPYLVGYWKIELVYDSPRKDCLIAENKTYVDFPNPIRLNTWSAKGVRAYGIQF